MFVFSLISQRHSEIFKADTVYSRWEDLKRLAIQSDIKLSEKMYMHLKNCLIETKILKDIVDGKIDMHLLKEVSDSYYDRNLIPDSLSHDANIDIESVSRHESSTVARILKQVLPQWQQLKKILNNYTANSSGYKSLSNYNSATSNGAISKIQLNQGLRTAGTILATNDLSDLWTYLCRVTKQHNPYSADRVTSLTINDIENAFQPYISNQYDYGSMSAIMGEGGTDFAHKRHAVNRMDQVNYGGRGTDHIFDVMSTVPDLVSKSCSVSDSSHGGGGGGGAWSPLRNHHTNSAYSDYSEYDRCNIRVTPQINNFPWQQNESEEMSNIKRRVLQFLSKVTSQDRMAITNRLIAESRRSPQSGILERNALKTILSFFGLNLSVSDSQNLWTEICSEVKDLRNVNELCKWLRLPIVGDADGDQNRTAPSRSENRLEAHPSNHDSWNPTVPSTSASASVGPNVDGRSNGPDTLASALSDDDIDDDLALFESSVKILQRCKPELALLFRRLGGSTGTVRGSDVVHPFMHPPFTLPLNSDTCHRFVCRIAKVSLVTPPDLIYLRFNDIMNYLDVFQMNMIIHAEPREFVNIREKLRCSYIIKGKTELLISSLSNLRSRLRNMRTKGQVSSWEGLPDVVSINEFMKLMMTVDVRLTHEEIEFIHQLLFLDKQKQHEKDGRGSGVEMVKENGLSLAAAINFFVTLLQ